MMFFKKKKMNVKFWRAGSSVIQQGRWLTVDVRASTESIKGAQLIRDAAFAMLEASHAHLDTRIEKNVMHENLASPRDDVDQTA